MLGFVTRFGEELIWTPDLQRVKVSQIEHYKGTTNPIDHPATFKAQMSVPNVKPHGATSSLQHWRGLALTWFTEFPLRNILDFASLEAAFKKNFIVGKRHRKTGIHLMSIRQQRNEDLSDYIKKVYEESLKVSDLKDSVAFNTLMWGLNASSNFKLKLDESEVSTFCEAMCLAQNFIQASNICKIHEELKKRKNDHPTREDTLRDVPLEGRR